MRPTRLHALLLSSILALSAAPAAAQVVISQAYGGGGNTGATYTNDFVELFNRGQAPVALLGKSVQYGSATGNFSNTTALPDVTLQPGQYFLLQLASGANGVALPVSADGTGTLNLSGTAGKVALVNGTTALGCGSTALACTEPNLSLILDRLGYGTNSFPETAAAPGLSNSTMAVRAGAGCTDTDNNSADFTAALSAPRNTGSALNTCAAPTDPTNPAGTGAASPSSVSAGDGVLLTVAVVAGTNPTSSNLTVQADLSAIGGSASQLLVDDGSNGDLTAGDSVFSVATSVAPATAAGAKSLPFALADGEARTGSGNIALSVVARVAIHDIQGSGRVSLIDGAEVITEGIVTAVKSNAFFLQTAPGEEDGSAATSQGIIVFTGAAPPSAAAVGNRVLVAGRVDEFTSGSNPNQLSLTEIVAPSVTLLSTGNTLPAPVVITAAESNPASSVDNLERYEGMRVSVPGLKVTAPTEGSISEANATSTANGTFYGVLAESPRPYREPGIGALDVTPIPGGISPPRFDTNPERIRVQSLGQIGGSVIAPDAGATVAAFTGVLDYGFGTYTVLPDVGQMPLVTGGQNPTAVADPASDEITIASFNLLRFYDDFNDPGGDVVLTTDAFERRLDKTARAICQYVRSPDILGVVEVENLNVLTRLAQAINLPGSGCHRDTQYVPYLVAGNDVGNINVGYLVRSVEVAAGKPRVQVEEVVQFGKTDVDTNPNGSTSILNDRPPLMLRAIVNQANGGSYPVTVIANHLRSLSGVNSTDPGSNGWSSNGARIRAKRASQARFLAQLVEDRQVATPAEHIVLLGDFNAFEFSDGYVDTMGIVTGREAPSSQVLNYVDSPITAPLTNMTTLSAPEDRYSFVFEGNAQTLDHIVANAALLAAVPGARIEHARINADFGNDNFGDFSIAVRVSDHDPVVMYLPVAAFGLADLRTMVGGVDPVTAGKTARWNVLVENNGPNSASDVLVRLVANAELPTLAVTAPVGFTCGTPASGAGETVVECAASALGNGANATFLVDAATEVTMPGTTITLSSRIDSATADNSPDNNFGFFGIGIAAPQADIGVGIGRDEAVVLERDDTIDFTVANSGRDDADSVRVVMSLASTSSKLSPIVPAGWICGDNSYDGVRSSVTCDFAGAFAPGRVDSLALRVTSPRTGVVVASVAASTPTPDADNGNNADFGYYLALVRGSKPPRE